MPEHFNPFSTRFIVPGAIPYERLDGGSLQELLETFLGPLGGWAAIVGPHGTGKSTLLSGLMSLVPPSKQRFHYCLSSSQRSLGTLEDTWKRWNQHSIVFLDSYEQLSHLSAWRLRRQARRCRAALLVTVHQSTSPFPTLWQTSVDESQARILRDRLLASHPDLAQHPTLEKAWQDARQLYPSNLRESFFVMYDWAEKQKRLASSENLRAV